jgi:hypothetical protein
VDYPKPRQVRKPTNGQFNLPVEYSRAEQKPSVIFIRFRIAEDEKAVKGRDAWALAELLAAGARGVTPIANPGPRWSAYVRKLRKVGVAIETVHEEHGGIFAGHHARYVLRSPVQVIETRKAA